jgi:uncharacterized membrane protein YkvA (DUF1232 family)
MWRAWLLRSLRLATKDPASAAAWVAKVSGRGGAIAAHAAHLRPAALRGLANRVRLALECLRDVRDGRYGAIPWKTAGSLAVALTYFLLPMDAVPDVLPVVGFVDDAAVLGLVFTAVEHDLRSYCAWRGFDAADYFESV